MAQSGPYGSLVCLVALSMAVIGFHLGGHLAAPAPISAHVRGTSSSTPATARTLRPTFALPSTTVDTDKVEVEKYFEDTAKDGGFDRWRRIYGEDDNVNAVQKDIREGHQITVDKVLAWIDSDRTPIKGQTVADLGCGIGSLAVPLAQKGAIVSASDISGPMADAARERARASGVDMATFEAYKSDLESVKGSYNTVICIDVMIHYPENKMQEMVAHLASLATDRVIISFAPKTWYYELLKKVGSLFPGPSKTTRAYLHSEEKVVAALQANGFLPERRDLTATSFYFSRLIEAKRVKSA